MSRVNLKRILLLVMVLFVIFFLYTFKEKNGKLEPKINISEIDNTEEMYSYPDSEVVTIRKHYMIINPPEELYELKTVIEKYYKDNPINKETLVKKNKKGHIEVYFYRISKKMPKNWQPNESYFETDRIEHHKNDLIAAIFWSDSHPGKTYYSIMRKSSGKNDYGEVIEELEYINDQIIE
jgi:hypothetical protein